jgi:hypothetical protein
MDNAQIILNLIKNNEDQLDSVDITSMSKLDVATALTVLHELENAGKIVRCSKGIGYTYKTKSNN